MPGPRDARATPPPAPGRRPGWRAPSSLAILAYLAACSAGVAFVVRDFGIGLPTAILALFPAFPLIIAERLRLRPAPVRRREYAYLAVVLIAVPVGAGFVVRDWYEKGMDLAHAESEGFAALDRALKRDPAFRNVTIHPPQMGRKSAYWVDGTVATRADLDRLRALAARCGLGRRLDEAFTDGKSITIDAEVR